ncbi:rod shape-determining protein MreC [Poseidonibacter lekithochrous]|uniref:rod shape-determining protein MreC n=1 Tax=Poseidonibacter TaxID=2321187 RepID=UPI001C0A636A|nr:MULTISPECIES: rod shape-determining protein MreC [Poseidonibacter]MBU3014657.1 rod shape-determining protein MreC [Poseidonibacter lekithochrous]MDO6827955.1 rod shape-determining protein MreC [Poseidonibacter sp. 1_MG-2023]
MRKFLFITLFLLVSLLYLFEVDKLIIKNFTFFNDLKLSYINKVIGISTTVEKYFNQVNNIERLQIENNELKQYKILYTATQKQLDTIKEFVITMDVDETKPNIKLAKVLSYINFNDFTKVWLDQKKEDDSILGLITEEYAAGIVINENGKSVALLNGNKESSYAVFIGEDKVPGIITSSKDGKNLQIQYIPIWADIKIGDEVITSGMDNIFFEGLKVGRIIEENTLPDMQTAIIKPYANVLKKKYFYTYKHYSHDIKEENTKK